VNLKISYSIGFSDRNVKIIIFWEGTAYNLVHINVSVERAASNVGMVVDSINLKATCFLYIGQAFRYSPENAFYIFNQQIYFIN